MIRPHLFMNAAPMNSLFVLVHDGRRRRRLVMTSDQLPVHSLFMNSW